MRSPPPPQGGGGSRRGVRFTVLPQLSRGLWWMNRHDPWRTALARRLRREATDAERRLWSQLRRVPEAHWRRQHPIVGFIVDFYSASAALGVELDGGQHFTPSGLELDRHRDQELAAIGILTLRYDDATVLTRTREVTDEIWRVWDERRVARTR